MKKNVMMRAASTLLVAVLLTTCAISGTFAKYTTSASGTDSARVAKWGVVIAANGTTFANTYTTDDSNVTAIANSVVSSENSKNVLAPGTKGNMTKIMLSGTPEVAVRVSYNATVDFGENWKNADDKFYCPIFITITAGSTETPLSGFDYESIEDFENAVASVINNYSAEYGPQTDLSTKDSEYLSVSWKWEFSGATGSKYNQSDEKDTFLGNLGKDDSTKAPTISLTIKTTVTQID